MSQVTEKEIKNWAETVATLYDLVQGHEAKLNPAQRQQYNDAYNALVAAVGIDEAERMIDNAF